MNTRDLSLAGVILLIVLGVRIAPNSNQQASHPRNTSPESKVGSHEVEAPPVWQVLCQLNPNYGADPRTDQEFLRSGKNALDPECLAELHPTEAWIRPLIATVADPVRTNLGLSTDRTIESIQAASAEAGYIPYLQGLAWPRVPSAWNQTEISTDLPSTDSLSRVGMRKHYDSRYPGVLLFRASEDSKPPHPRFLAVFLVSETPTGGLDKEQFLSAVRIIGNIPRGAVEGASPRTIAVAGPNFSGSVGSLRELAAELAQTPRSGAETFAQTADPVRCLHAFSGSVTNAYNNSGSMASPGCQPRIESIQTDDQTALARFRDWAAGIGLREDQIAILSEEGTQYGTLRPDHFLQLHFPRGIASLRNATDPGQALLPSSTRASGPQRLPMRWQDSESQSDEVPLYGAYQTSLSQETVLASLADTLRTEDIKALGIMASDPWDVTFLIHWFTEASPNTRLFVRDVDFLYLRTPDLGLVPGVLAVSDYPLIAENQFWSADEGHRGDRHLVTLPSSSQESQYNAFTELLEQLRPPIVDRPLRHLEDQVDSVVVPGAPRKHLWLAATASEGYLPIKLLSSDPPGLFNTGGNLHTLNPGKPSYSAIVLWMLIAMAATAHALGLVVSARLWRGLSSSSRSRTKLHSVLPCFLTFDLEDSGDAIAASKFVSHAVALSTAALGTLVAGASFVFFWKSTFSIPHYHPYRVLAGLVLLVTLFVFAVACRSLHAGLTMCAHICKTQSRLERDIRALGRGGVVLLVFPFGGILFWFYLSMSNTFDYAFMHLRDLHLGSGIAPVVPILLLLAVFYCGVWVHLRRVARWEYGSADMPAGLDEVFPSNCSRQVDRITHALLKFPERPWGWILLACIGLGLLLFRPVATMDMLEPRSVQRFTLLCFVFASLVLWSNWLRFMYVWQQMLAFLRILEKLPMRAAFSRISTESALSIWSWNVAPGKLLPLREGVEALRGLHRLTGDKFVTAKARERLLSSIRRFLIATSDSTLDAAGNDLPEAGVPLPATVTVGELKRLYREMRQAMTNVINQLIPHLTTYWQRGEVWPGNTPIPVDRPRRKTDSRDRRYELAEELVALRYYSYIRYVGTELRHLLMFVILAFSGLFVALHGYAFRASHTIDLAFIALFISLALGIVLTLGQQERDALLSRLQHSTAGELGRNFYLDVLKYAGIPALALIASQIPSISNFFLRWIQPSLDAFH